MAKPMPKELEEVFTTQSDKTRVNYKNMLLRLRKALPNEDPIKDFDPDVLIKIIKEMDIPATSKLSMLTVCIIIFKHHFSEELGDGIVAPFIKLRDELNENAFDESRKKDTELLAKGITLKKLTEFMNSAYEDKDWVKFIINYLLLTFQTRNEDVNVLITKNKEDLNKTDNFILLYKSSCVYIRNNYKTVDIYKPKDDVIRNKKMITALHTLLGDKEKDWLLKTGGEHIIPTELNRAVSNQTFDKIGSTKYFKILSTVKRNIEKMSDNRGTNPDTIVHSYKMNKKINLKKKVKLVVVE